MHSARQLGTNAHHHQSGALPSAIPAMWSESQPGLRWLATSGTRSSSLGTGGGSLKSVTASAIKILLGETGAGRRRKSETRNPKTEGNPKSEFPEARGCPGTFGTNRTRGPEWQPE